MKGFALLWSKMLVSSLWVKESKETRLVWVTLLMMKDEEGRIYSSEAGIAHTARVSDEECHEALERFMAPDPGDTSEVEEGRRLRKIQGGWEIINHELYRYSTSERREFWRKTKAEQRLKKKALKRGKPSSGESLAMAMEERGDREGAERVAEEAGVERLLDRQMEKLNEGLSGGKEL